MAQTAPDYVFETVGDLLESLGGIPPGRVHLVPHPGTATVEDVIRIHDRENRLCELVDGTLVEKTAGARESFLALELAFHVQSFNAQSGNRGMLLGADGAFRLMRGLVRIPDCSFTRWDRLPGGKVPAEPIPDLIPDLAIEVLSSENGTREMERKLKEYILCGVRLVWYADPATRTVRVFSGSTDATELTEVDVLDGADVLPGFRLPVRQLFAKL
ncbi:Uma2 family endonuclease [Fimbriiglobus ruber]|uniref:Putative restriction endonuclease domain-containing protein n=1 Tax=Fimbriiglobus ruber TaxID=1908690 RepID=A0A225D9B8_9BACT|nr:Uma2 family endonuclease [Fimbriiglobus ruber]OWK36254.1 hypothetical protein FRUB_08817 [Fimbriiglobus ruber]